jgi:SAM-dependent methyltransferase
MDSKNFKKKYSKFYNIFYKKKNYKKEVIYIKKILKKFKILEKNILEFGVGTGSHAKYFIQNNYKVTGVDRSMAMLSEAKKKKNLKLINADIKDVNLNKKFGIILSLFCVINYMTSDRDLKKTFINASRHLKKGGIFAFDFWYTPAVKHLKIKSKEIVLRDNGLTIKRKTIPLIRNDNVIDILFKIVINSKAKITNFFEKHRVRHFDIDELAKVALDNKLLFLDAYSMLTFNKPSKNSWSVFIIFKKI